MLRIIGEIAAAALTASALLMGHAHSETVVPGVPVSCITESMLLARLGQSPHIILRGDDLQKFQNNIRAQGGNPPDDDEILVFSEDAEQVEKVLFVSFKNDCVTHAIIVPEKEFLQYMEGA